MAIGTAAAILGSAVVGGAVASKAAGKAASAQRDAANTASSTELAMFDQNREDMQPWREAGTAALSQLTAGTARGGDFNRDFSLSDFRQDPGYQFRMDQGQQAFERSAAARGGALSGGALKGLARYGQDYASGEYQNAYNRFNNDRTTRFNRLSSLAGTGQTATRDVASMGTQTAQNIGQNQMAAGNARASGYVGQANAITGGLNNLSTFAMMGGFGGGGVSPTSAAAPNALGYGMGYTIPGG